MSPQKVGTSSTPKLSDIARYLAIPEDIKSTQFGRVEKLMARAGIQFDPWQQGLGRVALGVNSEGKWAATVGGVVLSIPRQVGKTFTVGSMIVGLCVLIPGMRVIWTSHHGRTTDVTFQSLRSLVRRPALKKLLKKNGIRTTNGEEQITFANESAIMFGSREQGFGRGFTNIDIIVFDEAQKLSLKALEDMVPATNQAQNPYGGLIFFMGTPPRPKIDVGESFSAKRKKAIDGTSKGMVYVEFSADQQAALDDPKQWRKANPSYPRRTPHEAMLRMRENIPDDESWKREALGIWHESEIAISRRISAELWDSIKTDGDIPDGVRSFAAAYSIDGKRMALAGAVRHDGGVHLEIIGVQRGVVDQQAVAEWLAERWKTTAQIAICGRAGASLGHRLKDLGVPGRVVTMMTSKDYYASCSMLEASAVAKDITVPQAGPGDVLEDSVAVCDSKTRVGGWGWLSTAPDGDETPLEAISAALWVARTTVRNPNRRQVIM